MDTIDSEDFFSIGMGFVKKPGIETGVKASDTASKYDKIDCCCKIEESCDKAEKSIQEDKEKTQIIVETNDKDEDSYKEESDNSIESYLDRDKRKKVFSLENAVMDELITENINSATCKELMAAGNVLILSRNALSTKYKNRTIDENKNSPSAVVLNNMLKSDSSINTNFTYLEYKTNSLETVYAKLLDFIDSFTIRGEVGENIVTLSMLGDDVLNVFNEIAPEFSAKVYSGNKSITEDIEKICDFIKTDNGCEIFINKLFGLHCVNRDYPFKNVVDNIELVSTLLNTRNKLIDLSISDKFETGIDNIRNITKYNDISVEFDDKLVLEKVTELVYRLFKIVCETVLYFAEDIAVIYDSTIDSIVVGKEESK